MCSASEPVSSSSRPSLRLRVFAISAPHAARSRCTSTDASITRRTSCLAPAGRATKSGRSAHRSRSSRAIATIRGSTLAFGASFREFFGIRGLTGLGGYGSGSNHIPPRFATTSHRESGRAA